MDGAWAEEWWAEERWAEEWWAEEWWVEECWAKECWAEEWRGAGRLCKEPVGLAYHRGRLGRNGPQRQCSRL